MESGDSGGETRGVKHEGGYKQAEWGTLQLVIYM